MPFCPECGGDVPAEALFCISCGRRLTSISATAGDEEHLESWRTQQNDEDALATSRQQVPSRGMTVMFTIIIIALFIFLGGTYLRWQDSLSSGEHLVAHVA